MATTKYLVELFLEQLKRISASAFKMDNQDKTREFMTLRDLDKKDVLELLHELTYCNYSSGPAANDWSRGGKVWVFGLETEPYVDDAGQQVPRYRLYIKLNVYVAENNTFLACMSFHPIEEAMSFPLCGKNWSKPNV